MCGIYLNQGRVVLLLMYLPIAAILYNTDNLLILLGQDPEVSNLAGQYVRCMLPGILGMALFDLNKTFLNAVHQTLIPTFIQMCAVPLHLMWAFLIVDFYGFGFLGACYALNITYLTLCIGITLYSSKLLALKEAWFFSSGSQIWGGILIYLNLGAPGSIMVGIGYLATEIMTLFSGYLGL